MKTGEEVESSVNERTFPLLWNCFFLHFTQTFVHDNNGYRCSNLWNSLYVSCFLNMSTNSIFLHRICDFLAIFLEQHLICVCAVPKLLWHYNRITLTLPLDRNILLILLKFIEPVPNYWENTPTNFFQINRTQHKILHFYKILKKLFDFGFDLFVICKTNTNINSRQHGADVAREE